MSATEALPGPPDSPDAVQVLVGRLQRTGRGVDDLASGLRRDRSAVTTGWSGPAAASCRDELRRVESLVGSVLVAVDVVARLAREHAVVVAEAVVAINRLRHEYDDLVAQQRFSSAALWAADLPGPLRRLRQDELLTEHGADLGRVRARHAQILTDVHDSAQRTARTTQQAVDQVLPATARSANSTLGRLVATLPLLAWSRAAAGVGGPPPPPGASPVLVRGWWSVLAPAEQDRLVARHPGRLGHLAGLPAAARSAANERRLEEVIATLLAAFARGPLHDNDWRRLETCLIVQEALRQVRSRVHPATGQAVAAALLVFAPGAFRSHGRVALAVGDLDTARNVAVLVPGMGSQVRSTLGRLTDDAGRVTARAGRTAPGSSTATIAWIGYQAPGSVGALVDRRAARGGDLLARDVLAVQAGRAVLPRVTLVGHSYGSVTTGIALREHWTGVDDVVLLGSPGAVVERARDLRVPPGHVYVGASSRDPVSYLDRFGADPTHADFGAVRIRAEDVTRNPWRMDLDDHTKYYDARTESLANIVRVVVGDHDAVRRAGYRAEDWLLPDGLRQDPETYRSPARP